MLAELRYARPQAVKRLARWLGIKCAGDVSDELLLAIAYATMPQVGPGLGGERR